MAIIAGRWQTAAAMMYRTVSRATRRTMSATIRRMATLADGA
jgi:hypothetical protein